MNPGEGLPEGGVRPIRPWPKVHLVYFLLAGFDILAIFGGLFLSHQVIRVFDRNIEEFAALDRLMASSWILVDTAADAQTAVADALTTGDTTLSVMNFKRKLHEVRQEAARLQASANSVLPERATKRANLIMARIGSAVADMEISGLRYMRQLEGKDSTGAVKSLANLEPRYRELRNATRDLNQLVARVKISSVDQRKATVEDWRKYEYLIGALVALIVCGVAAYGMWVGRLMKQKYNELAASNAELEAAQADSAAFAARLQAINDDVTQLNRELAENMRRLSEAQDERAQRSRLAELDRLSAMLAQELRNPLSLVRTSAYLASRKLQKNDPDLEPQFARIDKGVARCDRIISELLDFSRGQALAMQTLRVDDWIAQVVKQAAERLPEPLRFECNLGLGATEAMFDPERLERVLATLLQNAADGLAGGTGSPLITVSSRQSKRGIEISVADNGPGLAANGAAKIRVSLLSSNQAMNGLGLTFAERILEQHGGGLEVESSPGSGTCFVFWFPPMTAVDAVA